MKNFKFLLSLLTAFVLLTSCSYFKDSTTKNNDESHKVEGENPNKEKVLEKTSLADLTFYNKYIDISNKISETADEVNKNFLTTVPDPSTISKGSFM